MRFAWLNRTRLEFESTHFKYAALYLDKDHKSLFLSRLGGNHEPFGDERVQVEVCDHPGKKQDKTAMRKVITIVAAVLFVGTVLSACKAHEKCPAYGKAEKVQVEKQA